MRDVRLLDSGRDLWNSHGRDTTLEVPAGTVQPDIRSWSATTPRSAPTGTTCSDISGKQPLIDVRSPQEYTGERTHMPYYPKRAALRGGHIPTAKSIPWAKAARDSGQFRSRAELEELYGFLNPDDESGGVLPDR